MSARALERAFKFFSKYKDLHVIHRLPKHYKKYIIGTFEDPVPVHYYPEPNEYVKNRYTHEIKRKCDVPIPLIFPKEADEGLWGGEGIIKGYMKRDVKWASRFPRYWTPVLKRAVLRSDILDKELSIIVTERTLELIDQAYGFDNYILKTPVVDLRSRLGLRLRRDMIYALIHKTTYKDNPAKQQDVYETYKEFIVPEEELEWMGLSLQEAMKKQRAIETAQAKAIYPLKRIYRKELFESLKALEAAKVSEREIDDNLKQNWFSKWNPFSKEKSQDEVQPKT